MQHQISRLMVKVSEKKEVIKSLKGRKDVLTREQGTLQRDCESIALTDALEKKEAAQKRRDLWVRRKKDLLKDIRENRERLGEAELVQREHGEHIEALSKEKKSTSKNVRELHEKLTNLDGFAGELHTLALSENKKRKSLKNKVTRALKLHDEEMQCIRNRIEKRAGVEEQKTRLLGVQSQYAEFKREQENFLREGAHLQCLASNREMETEELRRQLKTLWANYEQMGRKTQDIKARGWDLTYALISEKTETDALPNSTDIGPTSTHSASNVRKVIKNSFGAPYKRGISGAGDQSNNRALANSFFSEKELTEKADDELRNSVNNMSLINIRDTTEGKVVSSIEQRSFSEAAAIRASDKLDKLTDLARTNTSVQAISDNRFDNISNLHRAQTVQIEGRGTSRDRPLKGTGILPQYNYSGADEETAIINSIFDKKHSGYLASENRLRGEFDMLRGSGASNGHNTISHSIGANSYEKRTALLRQEFGMEDDFANRNNSITFSDKMNNSRNLRYDISAHNQSLRMDDSVLPKPSDEASHLVMAMAL